MAGAAKSETPTEAPAEAPLSLEEYQAKQAADWGKYVALDTIYVGGVRAFNAGDAVPIGHVERGLVNPNQVKTIEKDA